MNEGELSLFTVLFITVLMIGVIACIIFVERGQRRIPVQYAKRVVGRKVYGGQSTFLPLKVNYSGVMPIIFAGAILMFPSQIIGWMFPNEMWARNLAMTLGGGGSGWVYYGLTGLMIFFFSYF